MIDERILGDVLNLRIESAHSAASQARRRVREFLDHLGVSGSVASDAELVVAELVSNAVDHGSARPIDLELLLSYDALYLTVSNHRSDRRVDVLPTEANNDPLSDRGRGLTIVHTVVDGMWVHGQIDSMSVTCLLKRNR